MRVLQADECDEKPDADGDGALQCHRNRVEKRFAHIRQGQQDEDQALAENRRQGKLPGIAHLSDDRIGEKGVEPHRRGKCERQIGEGRHQEACNARGKRRGRKYGSRVHARRAEDQRVHGEDISHRHERRQSRQHLRLHRCAVFPEMKQVFQHVFHPIRSFLFFDKAHQSRALFFYSSGNIRPWQEGAAALPKSFRRSDAHQRPGSGHCAALRMRV